MTNSTPRRLERIASLAKEINFRQIDNSSRTCEAPVHPACGLGVYRGCLPVCFSCVVISQWNTDSVQQPHQQRRAESPSAVQQQ
jgi:hypothetical protein